MASKLDSSSYKDESAAVRPLTAWFRLSMVAAASALAGGLAAAWYYRSTLKRFQESQSENAASNFGISEGIEDD